MSVVYRDDAVTLFHGDCRDVLPTLGATADAVVTDPPYGIAYVSNVRAVNLFGEIVGDDEFRADWLLLVRQAVRADRGVPLFVFANDRSLAATQSAASDAGFVLRTLLVWDKQALGPGDLDDWAKRTEFIVYATSRGAKLNGARDGNLISVPRVDGRKLCHPTEKPVDLLKYLIIRSTDPGDVVLDPFCGAGSTLIAAKGLGRKAIGIEVDERYCEIAARRLAQEVLDLGGVA